MRIPFETDPGGIANLSYVSFPPVIFHMSRSENAIYTIGQESPLLFLHYVRDAGESN